MRDLWNDLARRVRAFAPEVTPDLSFGFEDAVLRRLRNSTRVEKSWLEGLAELLRPALGLAFAMAILCVLLQARAEQQKMPANLVAQTEALLEQAIINE